MPPKKRGRKPKKKKEGEDTVKPPPKKRGRKPKGGKIVKLDAKKKKVEKYVPNIIMHLKVSSKDVLKDDITSIKYEPNIENPEAYNIDDVTNLNYQLLSQVEQKEEKQQYIINVKEEVKNVDTKEEEKINIKDVWTKLNALKHNLRMKNVSEKESNCFWCTCSFDNPAIYIPKNYVEDKIEVYGCFCSPECAVSYLKNEKIDTSTMWDRYALLNNIYGKIYDYEKNIKPAPSPFYTLDKFYGNLTIQEYRKLLKNDRLIMVINKPMAKILPEIYEENNEIPNILNNIASQNEKKLSSKYTLKSKEKFKTKTAILKNSFNVF